MYVLADMILPIFLGLYLSIFAFPVGVAVVFFAEFAVYYLRHRQQIPAWKIAWFVIGSNFVSFMVGLIVVFVLPLPEGIARLQVGPNHANPDYIPSYYLFVFAIFPAAWALTCVIEYLCIYRESPAGTRRKLWWSCFFANLASYTVLFALYALAVSRG